ncbi:agmatine deiminase family protein [Barnesiella viscericola]|uniref:Agmatine deiminase family protein n=1 Tax=Barnesiella viscericola TaxID=397865 RepID=A0A921SW23_9BACT|nr:agmatine deiminase family protein [Barnesiella viscericola]HJG89932.1 agmatine deiminase family protein [Barnesiella viscericola]
MTPAILFPAEWYPQSGIQLTWPHEETDWAYMLDEVTTCYIELAREIARRERLLIVTPHPKQVKQLLQGVVDLEAVTFAQCPTNDTWARDHGGITLFCDGTPAIYDFKFNGWGLKFAANYDNLITSTLCRQGRFNARYENRLNFVVEGGALESDGAGTLLTTSECLLSPNRNGEWSQARIEEYLKETFGLQRVLWLDHGYLAGDDTDSHIDTLARFAPGNTIVYVQCTDPTDEHYEALRRMEEQLRTFTTLEGTPYRLLPLPMANAVYDENGERLPATYANFLIMNDAVLYPTYRQPANDQAAAQVLQQAFPDREIVGIDCSPLIRQHGSLHCVTMQYPQNVLR